MTELKIRLNLEYTKFKRLLWADSCGHDFKWTPTRITANKKATPPTPEETTQEYWARCNKVVDSTKQGEEPAAPFAGVEFLWQSWATNVAVHPYYSGAHHLTKTNESRVPWQNTSRDKTLFERQIRKANGFQHSGTARTQLNICEAPREGAYKIVTTYSGGLTNRKNMLCSIMSSVDRNDFSGESKWSCNVPDGAKELNPNRGMLLEFYDPQGGVYCWVRYSGSVKEPKVELKWHHHKWAESSLSSAGEMSIEVKKICKERKLLEAEELAAVMADLAPPDVPSVGEFERDIEFVFLKKFMADNGQMWGTFMQHTSLQDGQLYPICIDEGDFTGFLNWYYMIDGCTGIITNDPYASTLLRPLPEHHTTDVHGTGWTSADAPLGVWSSQANEFTLPICLSITITGSYYTTEDGLGEAEMQKNAAREKANTENDGLINLLTASTVVNAVAAQVDRKEKLGRIWLKIVPKGTPVAQNIKVMFLDDINLVEKNSSSIAKDAVIEHLVNVVAHFHVRNKKGHSLSEQDIQTMGDHLPDAAQEYLRQLFAIRLAAGVTGKNNFKKKIPKKQTKKQPKKKNEKQPKKKPKKQPKKQPKKKTKKKPKKQT